MSHIRLRLALSGVGIEFEGSPALYQRWIEPIVAATCARGADDPPASASTQQRSAPDPTPSAASQPTAPVTHPAAAHPHTTQAASAPDQTVLEPQAPDVFQPKAPERFRQFVSQVGSRASTTEQQLMAFGFYLWNYEKQNTFSAQDLRGFFGLLHREIPENIDALVEDLTTRKRFLESSEDDPADRWRLTGKGVNYVKNRLLGSV